MKRLRLLMILLVLLSSAVFTAQADCAVNEVADPSPVDGTTGGDSINCNGENLTSGADSVTIETGDGNDSLNIDNTNITNTFDGINMGNGQDRIEFDGGSISATRDAIIGGSGNDTFIINSTTITGDADNDDEGTAVYDDSGNNIIRIGVNGSVTVPGHGTNFVMFDVNGDGLVDIDDIEFYPTFCPSDWDANGVVNSTDVSLYLNDWFSDLVSGGTTADYDENGVVNSTDVSVYVNSWFNDVVGCSP